MMSVPAKHASAALRIVAALAAAAAAGGASAQVLLPEAAKPASRDFFTESHVMFPEIAGPFKLLRSARDPEVAAGVSLLYRYNDDFDTDFEVFVYPLGDTDEKEALELGEAQMRETFMEAQRAGLYEKVDFKRTRDVEIPVEDGMHLEGRHVRFTAMMSGQPSISHAVIAYRDAYLIKLRASSARGDKRKFERLVDASIEALLPKISVQSIGACSQRLVRAKVNPKKALDMQDPKTAATVAKVLRIANRHLANGCVASFDGVLVPPGMKIEKLTFPPGSWDRATEGQGDAPADAEASSNP